MRFKRVWLRQFMSMGRRTTSEIFFTTKSMHSWTRELICKKSLEIRIEMTFLMSRFGTFSPAIFVEFERASYWFKAVVYKFVPDDIMFWEFNKLLYYCFYLCLKYLINHSKIFTSQCTEISMSSTDVASVRYSSKYFICDTNKFFSQVKSLFIFLFSS